MAFFRENIDEYRFVGNDWEEPKLLGADSSALNYRWGGTKKDKARQFRGGVALLQTGVIKQ